ncbi:hypothetical protein N7535_005894 [Penicillium sp. DV-2018c]|nr:hypothetical protein N7535_005894 [Penicillium sp. DV-2018c]
MSRAEDEVVVIPVTVASDGDMSTWPDSPYVERDDLSWREMLAENWLRDAGTYEEGEFKVVLSSCRFVRFALSLAHRPPSHFGASCLISTPILTKHIKGVTYIIEKLPDGYCLFKRPRPNNPQALDSFLFGHPSGKHFRSRVSFLPHFLALVKDELDSCSCERCADYKKMGKGSVAKPRGKADLRTPVNNDRQPTDPEGPDYWRNFVMKLKDKGKIDEPVEQPLNFDWVLTQEWLSDYCVKLVLDPAYVPRRGELVLWIWEGLEDGCLMHNPQTGHFEIFGNDNKWHGVPYWRAGVVTQTPENDTHTVDIVETPDNSRGLNYSGFRVETLPNPLSNDKSFSKQYTYVPLRNIRPFNAWQIFLQDQDRDKQHPSIENAMTVMSSFSMVHKYHIVGKGSICSILCKGIFLGGELLAVSDTIRLKPEGFQYDDLRANNPAKITEVMVIEKISLRMIDIVHDDPEQLAKHYVPLISGRVYTTDPRRVSKSRVFPDPTANENPTPLTTEEATAAFRQVSMCDYGPWYRMAQGRTCHISVHVVIGRCYEPLAAELMFGTPDLGYDLSGVLEGRNYSSQADARIPTGNTFLWGDCRVETLGLTEINGVECGPTAPQRGDPQKWQAIIRISRGESSAALRRQAGIPLSEGRSKKTTSSSSAPRKKPQGGGLAKVAQSSKLVSAGLNGVIPDTDDEEYDDGSGGDDDKDLSELSGDALTESDSMDELA